MARVPVSISQDPFIQAQARRIRLVIDAMQVPLREVVTQIHSATGYSFSTPQLSRLQNGLQAATFEEVDVLAKADPQQRGREWLAWGDVLPKSALAAPGISQESGTPFSYDPPRRQTVRAAAEGPPDRAGVSRGTRQSAPDAPKGKKRRSG